MTFTDGVIVLRPLDVSDVAAHLAGEDEELVRWLNGGPGTQVTVEAHIRACMAAWRAGGPTFNFGIRAGVPECLVGTVDAHLELPGLDPVRRTSPTGSTPRREDVASPPAAVTLLCAYLAAERGVRQAVIRTHPANAASAAVALRTGFRLLRHDDQGDLDWYVRDLTELRGR